VFCKQLDIVFNVISVDISKLEGYTYYGYLNFIVFLYAPMRAPL